ncbi:hypothetical protein vBPaeMUSP25_30A [Pseudomonas phage vB_PaeM_USP_25]|nr:hypothetical protein vBPaeMUSP25_30A [Pseudomonas phage vB_PaeM_USP_25]
MFGFKKGASAKDDKKPAPSGTAEAPKTPEKPKNPIADYATGGATRRRMEALGLKDGGPVRGPGTGTSDDIEAVVPEGSYIMPADSTEQIGEQNLAGLGAPVDVRLSNGEYQLPPEQVHAVGVQALDQMKDATHTPADQQAQGFEPEMFFADGGEVEDPRRKRYAERVARYEAGQTPANTPDPSLPNYANRATPATSAPAPSEPSALGAGFKVLAGGGGCLLRKRPLSHPARPPPHPQPRPQTLRRCLAVICRASRAPTTSPAWATASPAPTSAPALR